MELFPSLDVKPVSKRHFLGDAKLFTTLSVSTSHVPLSDTKLLCDEKTPQKSEPFLVFPYEEGWHLIMDGAAGWSQSDVESAVDLLCDRGYSHAFVRLFRTAVGMKAETIMLGGGEQVYDDLPTFVW